MTIRRLMAPILAALIIAVPATADAASSTPGQRLAGLNGVQAWSYPGSGLHLNFSRNGGSCAVKRIAKSCLSVLTTTRASQETSLLPTSASGAAFFTYANNVPAIVPGVGLQVYQSATNFLLNSTAPVTQTTGSLATGAYTLWVNGSGSATMSAGSGTGCGTGVATNGTAVHFTITVAGTCTVTKTGSLNSFQLENDSVGTPLIITAGATATRAADTITAATGSWFNATAGTFVAKFSSVVPNTANSAVAGFDDGSSNNQIYPYAGGTALTYFQRAGGAVRYQTASGITLVNGTTYKVAMAYGVSPDFGAINNGNTQSLVSAGLPVGLNRLYLGASASAGDTQINGIVQEFIYVPVRLSNALTQGLTN